MNERRIPEEAQNFKAPKTPDGETYDVAGPKAALKKLEGNAQFQKGAENRAQDIFESGHLKEKIKTGDKVLYIGAGTGHVAKQIEQGTGATVVKFDLADLRTSDTKDNKMALANARRLPVKDGALDVVCLMDMLHHTVGQEEILQEALRVLKPGGKLLLMEDTIPNEGERGRDFKKWLVGKMDDVFNQQPKGVNPHNYHSIDEWENILLDAGFGVHEEDKKKWHWGIPDFVGASRDTRPAEPTLLRPFQATMFEVFKPEVVEESEK